jgi:predicted DNA-binding transcriptional regulator YafY
MRRADRLFQIVSLLRRRRLTTAAWLGERLEISERTVYRDIADLVRSGVPIEGEAGVGYRLDKSFDLPPLMFDREEIQALVLGARMVEAWADDDLRRAARSALDKVEAAQPSTTRGEVEQTALFALGLKLEPATRAMLRPLRAAVGERRKLTVGYRDKHESITTRTVRPLGIYFWGATWTLAAWCEMRTDFRNFRVDRMSDLQVHDERFELEPPVTLQAFVAVMSAT